MLTVLLVMSTFFLYCVILLVLFSLKACYVTPNFCIGAEVKSVIKFAVQSYHFPTDDVWTGNPVIYRYPSGFKMQCQAGYQVQYSTSYPANGIFPTRYSGIEEDFVLQISGNRPDMWTVILYQSENQMLYQYLTDRYPVS